MSASMLISQAVAISYRSSVGLPVSTYLGQVGTLDIILCIQNLASKILRLQNPSCPESPVSRIPCIQCLRTSISYPPFPIFSSFDILPYPPVYFAEKYLFKFSVGDIFPFPAPSLIVSNLFQFAQLLFKVRQ